MRYPRPTKEDWILLRVLRVTLFITSKAATDPDFIKPLLYLHKKLGWKQFSEMCDALNKEKQERSR